MSDKKAIDMFGHKVEKGPQSIGHKIRFQIEFMLTMLQASRMSAATAACDKALELCEEAHFLEKGREANNEKQ